MLLRSSLALSEMFQSCFGPDNQWAVRQEDDAQGLFHSRPHPSSWPLFHSPRPRSVVHHFQSRCPYGKTFGQVQNPDWFRTQNTWKVGCHRKNNLPPLHFENIPDQLGLFILWLPKLVLFHKCNYRALMWIWNHTGSKISRLLLPNACEQTSSKVLAKGRADSCYSGSRIHPFDHSLLATQRPPCLRDHSFGILSLGIVAPLSLLRTPNNMLTAHWTIPGCCSFYLIWAFHGCEYATE